MGERTPVIINSIRIIFVSFRDFRFIKYFSRTLVPWSEKEAVFEGRNLINIIHESGVLVVNSGLELYGRDSDIVVIWLVEKLRGRLIRREGPVVGMVGGVLRVVEDGFAVI